MLLEYFRTSVENFEDLQQINRDLEMTLPQQKLAMEAKSFRDELLILVKLYSFSKSKYTQFLSEKVEYLSKVLEKEEYYNPKTHFHYLWSKIDLYTVQKKTELLNFTINEMMGLFKIYPILETNNLKGIAYLRLAETNLLLKDYKNGIDNAASACVFFRNRPNNYWISKCVESFGHLYVGQWDNCKAIRNTFSLGTEKKNESAVELFHYIDLCLEYLEGNLKVVLQRIHVLSDAYSNKEHFNTNIRIFEIMILIELGDTYFAELKIDALRKHLERYEILPRDLACYRILNQLQLQSFNFQKENTKISDFLADLHNEHKWRAYSFEAIRFETWFEAMKNKVSYWELFQKEENTVK
jgi:hypothetical protein